MVDNAQESLNVRLKVFMDHTGLNNSQFADKLGVPRPSFSQIITGRNKKVSDIILAQIHKAFPELNIMWLMFGEGEMLVNESNEAKKTAMNEQSTSSPLPSGYDLAWAEFGEQENTGQNPEFVDGCTSVSGNGRENGAISSVSGFKMTDIARLSAEISSKINEELKSNLEKKTRRVVRITVFYDDNSYETFAPTSELPVK